MKKLSLCLLLALVALPVAALADSTDKHDRTDLTIDVVDAPDPVGPGRELTYRISVGNRGEHAARNVTVTAEVPAGAVFGSLEAPRGWAAQAPAPGATGTVTFTFGSLPQSPALTFLVTVRVSPDLPVGSVLSSTFAATSTTADANPDDNSVVVETRVARRPPPAADLRVDLDPFPNPAPAGGMMATMVIINNIGPQAATDVVVTVPIPAGATLLQSSISRGTITAPATGTAGDLLFEIDVIPTRRPVIAAVVVELPATPGVTFDLRATATASSIDPLPANNLAVVPIRISEPGPPVDLSISLEESADPIVTASRLTYRATIRNTSQAPAREVNAVVNIPQGTRFGAARTESGLTRTPPVGAVGSVGWRPGLIPPGATVTLDLDVWVAANGGLPLRNSAFVTSGSTDPDPADNTAETSTRIQSAGEALLQWDPPEGESAPPPRNVVVRPSTRSAGKLLLESGPRFDAAAARDDSDTEPVAYNIYTSSTPNPQPTEENLYTSVPPNQTTTTVPVAPTGSYFTVTAEYPDGESTASNSDGTGDTPGATITKVKMNSKIAATGSGFTDDVEVLLDGIPFVDASKLKKNGAKCVQKGSLLIGMTVEEYTAGGGTFLIVFRNSDGGTTIWELEK